MPRLETFSTADLAPRRRIEFWNDVACNTFTPIVADPIDLGRFDPSLSRTTVGDMIVSEVRSSPSMVRHTIGHVARTRHAMFFLHAQICGRSVNRQDGRESCLEAGDFTLFDNTRPYQMSFDERNTVLVVGIPDRLMRRHLTHPESVVALAMRRTDPFAGLLGDFLQRLWAVLNADSAPANQSVATALVNLVGGAYASIPQARAEASVIVESRRLRIVQYIEDHLRDAELCPATIAAAFRTTPRNLHLQFSRGDETVCRYILRRRLEECARILSDAAHRRRSISDIAFDLGFSSLTHFGRVFHDHYGVTASEYRHQRLHPAFDAEPLAVAIGNARVAC